MQTNLKWQARSVVDWGGERVECRDYKLVKINFPIDGFAHFFKQSQFDDCMHIYQMMLFNMLNLLYVKLNKN